MTEQLVYKSVNTEIKEFNIDTSGDFFTVKGIVSSYGNKDLDGDIIDFGAFTKSIQERPTVKIALGHLIEGRGLFKTRDMNKIGSMTLKEEGNYIIGTGKIGTSDSVKSELVPRIRSGVYDSFSVGFKATKKEKLSDGGFLFKEAYIKEVTLTDEPANQVARLLETKSLDENQLEIKELLEATKTLRDLEELLTSKCYLSDKVAMTIISKVTELKRDVILEPVIKEMEVIKSENQKFKLLQLIKEARNDIRK